jgi:hypothetical protein
MTLPMRRWISRALLIGSATVSRIQAHSAHAGQKRGLANLLKETLLESGSAQVLTAVLLVRTFQRPR